MLSGDGILPTKPCASPDPEQLSSSLLSSSLLSSSPLSSSPLSSSPLSSSQFISPVFSSFRLSSVLLSSVLLSPALLSLVLSLPVVFLKLYRPFKDRRFLNDRRRLSCFSVSISCRYQHHPLGDAAGFHFNHNKDLSAGSLLLKILISSKLLSFFKWICQ